MHQKLLILIPLIILLGWVLMSCEGPEGPAGPQGEQGDTGDPGEGFPTFTYMGDNAEKCGHCHSGTVGQWEETKHSDAYASLVEGGSENNPYCLQCHTVGFDVAVNFGDTILTDHGMDHNGFDDYWPPETAEDQARLDKLKDVQCENCHGSMGPTIYDHDPNMSYSTRIENGVELSQCATCHHDQVEEWHESGHGTVIERHEDLNNIEDFTAEWGRSSCNYCHTAEGFIKDKDPENADMIMPATQSMIGCAACHDPHSGDEGSHHQLRSGGLADVEISYADNQPATYSGYGPGQLCAQCHHARRDGDNVNGQIADGYAHFGPHGSPQADMFMGTGSYEIEGYEYDRGDMVGEELRAHKNTVEEGCVSCHLTVEVVRGREHRIHNFDPQVSTCQACHSGAADFNINGKAEEVNTLMAELWEKLGVESVDDLGNAEITTPEQRKAGYAWVFVNNDNSHGIHNTRYAKSLLQNAIDYLDTLP